jgi:protease IV
MAKKSQKKKRNPPSQIKLVIGIVGAYGALVILFIVLAIGLGIFVEYHSEETWDEYGYVDEGDWSDDRDYRGCNVNGIEIHGEIVTYGGRSDDHIETSSDLILSAIEYGEEEAGIKAHLIEVDSRGGYPVAGEEMMKFIASAEKPTVILIREAGLSAAYMAALGGDVIFASANSDIGSIGVTMSYLDYSRQNTFEGINFNQLSSGPYKDAGHPEKTLTADEEEIFQRDIDQLHQNFIDMVATSRGLPREQVEAIADGSSMLGSAALEKGLIDQIGSVLETESYIKKQTGVEDISLCWY